MIEFYFFRTTDFKLFFSFPLEGVDVVCYEFENKFLLKLDSIGVVGVYSFDKVMSIVSLFESDYEWCY